MKAVHRAIIVCALGYFIDIFDIQLYAVLRVASLTELGVPTNRLAAIGGYILNAQMFGMIVGAFLWGWLGDQYGRLKALYGSILICSVGTLLCSVVHDPTTYGVYRFISGFGLAGETGAAITLVTELLSPQKRGWGPTIVGGFGAFGPVFAVLISWFMPWRETYLIAGCLGLVIFVMRMKLVESAIFEKINQQQVARGFWQLYASPKRALTFVCCIALAVSATYGTNLLNFFSVEISKNVLKPGEIFSQKTSMLLFYVGLGFGNAISGAISQLWHSRRKGMAASLLFGALVSAAYLLAGPLIKFPVAVVYIIYFALGLSGSLALAVTIAAEQVGTNIRATSSILMSNFARGLVIPMVFTFQWLREFMSVAGAAAVVGGFLYLAAFMALYHLRETHGVDLDYSESIGRVKGSALIGKTS